MPLCEICGAYITRTDLGCSFCSTFDHHFEERGHPFRNLVRNLYQNPLNNNNTRYISRFALLATSHQLSKILWDFFLDTHTGEDYLGTLGLSFGFAAKSITAEQTNTDTKLMFIYLNSAPRFTYVNSLMARGTQGIVLGLDLYNIEYIESSLRILEQFKQRWERLNVEAIVLKDQDSQPLISIDEYSQKILTYTQCTPEDLPRYHIVYPYEDPQSIFHARNDIYDAIVSRGMQLYPREGQIPNHVTVLDPLGQPRKTELHYQGPVTINVLDSIDKCYACLQNETKSFPLKQCSFCYGRFCTDCISAMNATATCFGSIRSQIHKFDSIEN